MVSLSFMERGKHMQSAGPSTSLGEPPERLAALWLRLEALLGAVKDVRSAALVVGNMARYKDDPDLSKLADDLHGVHSTLQCRFDDVLRELREGLADDHKDQRTARPNTMDAA
jgi:hypothetical protein